MISSYSNAAKLQIPCEWVSRMLIDFQQLIPSQQVCFAVAALLPASCREISRNFQNSKLQRCLKGDHLEVSWLRTTANDQNLSHPRKGSSFLEKFCRSSRLEATKRTLRLPSLDWPQSDQCWMLSTAIEVDVSQPFVGKQENLRSCEDDASWYLQIFQRKCSYFCYFCSGWWRLCTKVCVAGAATFMKIRSIVYHGTL